MAAAFEAADLAHRAPPVRTPWWRGDAAAISPVPEDGQAGTRSAALPLRNWTPTFKASGCGGGMRGLAWACSGALLVLACGGSSPPEGSGGGGGISHALT